ncbi:hypothetical protein GCM10020255_044370 [Rhodococcus baikonurensis]
MHVDRHLSGLDLRCELRGVGGVPRPYGCSEPVLTSVGADDGVGFVAERDDGKRGAELLFVDDPHSVVHLVEDGRLMEVAVPVDWFTAGGGPGAIAHGVRDQILDPLVLRFVVDGPEYCSVDRALVDLDGSRNFTERLDQSGLDTFVRVHTLDGEADLSVVGEGAAEEAGGDRIHIHVPENDGRIVSAEFQSDTLEVVGSPERDLPPDRG